MSRTCRLCALLVALAILSSCIHGRGPQPTEEGAFTGNPVSRVVTPFVGDDALTLATEVMTASGLTYLPSISNLSVEQVDYAAMGGRSTVTNATVVRFQIPAGDLDALTVDSPCSIRIVMPDGHSDGPAISAEILDVIGEVPPADTPACELSTGTPTTPQGDPTGVLAIMTSDSDPSSVIVVTYTFEHV